jgi:hypothetical protein
MDAYMRRKQDTVQPEKLLQDVIAGLENDGPARHREAVIALLAYGPLRCRDALARELQHPQPVTWRDDVLAFLRAVVRTEGLDHYNPAQTVTRTSLHFSVQLADRRATIRADGHVRDLVVIQLVMLLQAVGLRRVRLCGSGDCPHLFVKMSRRRFCSARCQTRHAKRLVRQREREEWEQQQQMRQRRRRAAKGGR